MLTVLVAVEPESGKSGNEAASAKKKKPKRAAAKQKNGW